MNILYICADRGIPILGNKGASVHVRSIAEAFVRLGHQVTIVSPCLTKTEAEKAHPIHPKGTTVQFIKAAKVSSDLPKQQAREQQALAYRDTLYRTLLPYVNQYDLVFERYSLWSDVGARLAKATGKPLVLEVNAPLREEATTYRTLHHSEAAQQIEQHQFAVANAVMVVSQPLCNYVISNGGHAERTYILPNAVDPQQFHPAVRGGKVRNRYGLHGKRIIGFVGRVRPWHDIDTLLEAFSNLHENDKSTHLLLVGQTDDLLIRRITEYGVRNSAHVNRCNPPRANPSTHRGDGCSGVVAYQLR